jgi:hypothetical protein
VINPKGLEIAHVKCRLSPAFARALWISRMPGSSSICCNHWTLQVKPESRCKAAQALLSDNTNSG